MQELTSSSQKLNDIAEDLQVGISAFKLINGNLIFPQQQKAQRRMVSQPMPTRRAQQQTLQERHDQQKPENRQSETAKKANARRNSDPNKNK
jgi:hypothetical protein